MKLSQASDADPSVGLIAFHFPPIQGSSGVQRTLKNAIYLPDFGWRARVLTVWPSAYPAQHPGQLDELPDGLEIARLPALDTARHLSLRGRYVGRLALPDRWVSFSWLGFWPALHWLKQKPVDVFWSTYPIASAHLLAGRLARRLKRPWVADFRDLMLDDTYPREPEKRAIHARIEASVVRDADRLVVTTSGARALLLERYSELAPERVAVIENGFDEENFVAAEANVPRSRSARACPVLLHSGLVYPVERNPAALFAALAILKEQGFMDRHPFRVMLRASGNEAMLTRQIADCGLSEWVHIKPALGYTEALAEMLEADALLILQGSDCNHQVPAKLYEYARAGRPMLALTDPKGDTAAVFARFGGTDLAPLDDADAIAARLRNFIPALAQGALAARPQPDVVQAANRRSRCAELAALLTAVREDAQGRRR